MGTWAWPDVKGIGLFLLALYGALLSTFNLIQNIRKDRRNIKVEVSIIEPERGVRAMCIEATNVGLRSVTVNLLTLEIPGGDLLFKKAMSGWPGDNHTDLPTTLSDGRSARALSFYVEIAEALAERGCRGDVSVTAVCVDSSGKRHRGNSLIVKAAPWNV